MILEKLPESVLEMSSVIGLTNALSIVALKGGMELLIPSNIDKVNDHWLVEVIGVDTTRKLFEYYLGEEIYIPNCKAFINVITSKEILSDCEYLNVSGLARKYGYTRRGIEKVLDRLRNEGLLASTVNKES